MDRWERWSLRTAALYGLAVQGCSAILFVIASVTLHGPSLQSWPELLPGFVATPIVFALFAALRNWIFRASIDPSRE